MALFLLVMVAFFALGVLSIYLLFTSFPMASAQLISETVDEENAFTRFVDGQAERVERSKRHRRLSEQAMRYARFKPSVYKFRVADFGLMVYPDRTTSNIVRTAAIMFDNQYVRPFFALQGTHRQTVDVVFEIHAYDGPRYFMEKQTVDLKRRTTVIAQNWLPLEQVPTDENHLWLTVYVNNVAVGVRPFELEDFEDNEFVHNMRNDGELSPEVQRMMREDEFEPLSLDDLLQSTQD